MNPIVLLLFIACVPVAQGGMYRWVDENGVTVYSQSPPPGGEALQVKPPPPPASADETRRRMDEQLQAVDDYKEDRALAAKKKAEEREAQVLARKNCEAARQNLAVLEALSGRLVKLPDGSYTRLTEEQRRERMAEARKVTEKYCQ